MIRVGKPVQLFEWGEGTTTMNQTWDKIADGVLLNKGKYSMGATMLMIEVSGSVTRKNEKSDAIKVFQQGEAMTPQSERWGEVAMGKLKSIEASGGKSVVNIVLHGAAKIG
jgi:hypothetical protein